MKRILSLLIVLSVLIWPFTVRAADTEYSEKWVATSFRVARVVIVHPQSYAQTDYVEDLNNTDGWILSNGQYVQQSPWFCLGPAGWDVTFSKGAQTIHENWQVADNQWNNATIGQPVRVALDSYRNGWPSLTAVVQLEYATVSGSNNCPYPDGIGVTTTLHAYGSGALMTRLQYVIAPSGLYGAMALNAGYTATGGHSGYYDTMRGTYMYPFSIYSQPRQWQVTSLAN